MDVTTLAEITQYIERIFDLERKIHSKDWKIINLEFELALKQEMVDTLKKFQLKGDEYGN